MEKLTERDNLSEDKRQMDSFPRPELFDFHGVSMTHYVTDNWEDIQNFKARPDDIVIASYPKAGSTWICNILDQLHFSQISRERQTSILLTARVPHLDISIPALERGSGPFSVNHKGTDMVERLSTSPRIIRIHLPVHFMPKSFWEQKCTIVYVARNAKDTMVSYFSMEQMLMLHPEPGDWSSYFHRFMEGKMVFGSWYDHVNGWWKKKQTYSKLHYLFYEDLVEDTGREIDKLCCFLGLSRSVEEKEQIRNRVQFDNMKRDKMVNNSTFPGMDFKASDFIRKGKVGDWKNHFTVAQSEEFDEDYKKKMKDPTLQFRTEI